MKLIAARVKEFKSIWDSNEFSVGDVTCLVGKNEAGKTAILEALNMVNPLSTRDNDFDVTQDYPRAEVTDYQEQVQDGEREPADVVTVIYELEAEDIRAIEELVGTGVLVETAITLKKRYKRSRDEKADTRSFSIKVNERIALENLVRKSKLTVEQHEILLACVDDVGSILDALAKQEQTQEIKHLSEVIDEVNEDGVAGYIFTSVIAEREPKFLYFDEYYQMKGHENIELLRERQNRNKPDPSDYPMLGLIALAGLQLDDLINPKRTQDLINSLEGAGNRIGKKVLQYWSQNKHVQMRFDVRPGRPEDPSGMTSGTNIWANVYDSRHQVTTNLGSRSRGFVWFFSFMAWYHKIMRDYKNQAIILLFDEPGLFLHGRAQADLLRYIEVELKPKHQIIYSTHSPFMVDSRRFDRVRIVQDKGIDGDGSLPRESDGTKVITDVLEANEDSLFPLQGALGYEISQSLFIGPYCLIVEGVSDLLFLQGMSTVLEKTGRTSLDSRWTITPVGGSDNVPTFVSLLGSQSDLTIATLIDYQKKDSQSIENLYKRKLLSKKNVLTFSDFLEGQDADIEDMLGTEFYLSLINSEYSKDLQKPLVPKEIESESPRILVRLANALKPTPALASIATNHFRPARYFVENINKLGENIPGNVLNRFESAFSRLNSLLPR